MQTPLNSPLRLAARKGFKGVQRGRWARLRDPQYSRPLPGLPRPADRATVVNAPDRPLPGDSFPLHHRGGHGPRARRGERVTLLANTHSAAPAVVPPAQQKARARAGFEGIAAPLRGVDNAAQALTTPGPGDLRRIPVPHYTGSGPGLPLAAAVTAAAGRHARRGRS
jgi:hypothetical protein